MSYRVAQCNVQKPDSSRDNTATVNLAAAHADLVTFNEGNDTAVVAAITALAGWLHFIPRSAANQNPIIWRDALLRLISGTSRRLMVGGKQGTGKAGDHRRRGPSRWANAVLVREKSTGRYVIHVAAHLIAKTQTSAKWRRPLWVASLLVLRAFIAWLKARHPGTPIIVTGDFNYDGNIVLGAGFTQVKLAPTYGRRHYDHVFVYGDVRLSGISTLRTRSDHLAVVFTVTVGAQNTPDPAPEPPVEPAPAPAPRQSPGRRHRGHLTERLHRQQSQPHRHIHHSRHQSQGLTPRGCTRGASRSVRRMVQPAHRTDRQRPARRLGVPPPNAPSEGHGPRCPTTPRAPRSTSTPPSTPSGSQARSAPRRPRRSAPSLPSMRARFGGAGTTRAARTRRISRSTPDVATCERVLAKVTNTETKDWFDMATKDDLKAAVLEVPETPEGKAAISDAVIHTRLLGQDDAPKWTATWALCDEPHQRHAGAAEPAAAAGGEEK